MLSFYGSAISHTSLSIFLSFVLSHIHFLPLLVSLSLFLLRFPILVWSFSFFLSLNFTRVCYFLLLCLSACICLLRDCISISARSTSLLFSIIIPTSLLFPLRFQILFTVYFNGNDDASLVIFLKTL